MGVKHETGHRLKMDLNTAGGEWHIRPRVFCVPVRYVNAVRVNGRHPAADVAAVQDDAAVGADAKLRRPRVSESFTLVLTPHTTRVLAAFSPSCDYGCHVFHVRRATSFHHCLTVKKTRVYHLYTSV